MKFLSLILTNYGSYYGRHEIPLAGRGLVLVLGRNLDEPKANSNGAGKSTPWEALDWCLWGVVPRGDHVDSIINEEAGRDCRVGIRFEDDTGRLVQVERFRKAKDVPDGKENGLRLWVDGVSMSALDVAETQRKLEGILGLDREVFHAAILFSQNDIWRFADGTDSERMDILTRVLQLGEIDEWLEKTKKLVASANGELDTHRQALAQREAQVAGLQAMDFQRQIDEWDLGFKNHVATLQSKIVEVETQARELRSRASAENDLIQRMRVLEAARPAIPAPLDDRADADSEANARAQIVAGERRVDELGRRILTIRTHWVGTCPECGQLVSKEHVDREVTRLTQDVTALSQDIARWKQVLAAVQAHRTMLRQEFDARMIAYRQAVEKQAQEHLGLQKLLFEARSYQQQAVGAEALVEKLKQDQKVAEAQMNPWLAKRDEVQKTIDSLRTDILESEGRITGINARLVSLNFWIEAFGSKGLKNYILDHRLQEMTDAANQWVKMLTGGTFWIRFETQTMGRTTGKLSNKLNIRVFQYGRDGRIVERNYKSWSGGQKARVSMGVDFGLSRLVAARARQRYDLLILDEVFKHLDKAGREAVVEMLHSLRAEKSSLVVIDHDAEFGAAFENVLQVELKDRRSTILEVSGASKSATTVRDGRASTGTPVQTGPVQVVLS